MVSKEDIKRLLKEGYSKCSSGQKTISTAGTKERITEQPTPMAEICIRGLNSNTGQIYWVFSESKKGSEGDCVDAGERMTIPIDDLSKIWFDAEVDGEGFSYTMGGL